MAVMATYLLWHSGCRAGENLENMVTFLNYGVDSLLYYVV